MNKKRFLSIWVLLLGVASIYIHAGDKIKEYTFKYSDEGFSAISKKTGKKKYYSRGKVKKKGIDISSWSGDIDWKKLKESGIEFAMIREGYGWSSPKQVDKRFHKNIKEAQKIGMPCGVYHYSYATSVDEADKEADFCIDKIKDYKLEYPVAFDIEDDSQLNLDNRQRTDIVKAFCDKLRGAGYYVTIYSCKNWVKNLLLEEELRGSYDLWCAQWNENIKVPDLWCGMWQKAGDQKLDGIQYTVDINEGYYDYAKIMKELHLNGF